MMLNRLGYHLLPVSLAAGQSRLVSGGWDYVGVLESAQDTVSISTDGGTWERMPRGIIVAPTDGVPSLYVRNDAAVADDVVLMVGVGQVQDNRLNIVSGTIPVSLSQTGTGNMVQGMGAVNAAPATAGNPILTGITDGTTIKRLQGDSSGRQIMVGPIAPGTAASGNPVAVAGADPGGLTRRLLTETDGRLRVNIQALMDGYGRIATNDENYFPSFTSILDAGASGINAVYSPTSGIVTIKRNDNAAFTSRRLKGLRISWDTGFMAAFSIHQVGIYFYASASPTINAQTDTPAHVIFTDAFANGQIKSFDFGPMGIQIPSGTKSCVILRQQAGSPYYDNTWTGSKVCPEWGV